MMGDGVYKSTDEGKTWTHMGLNETGRIGRIVVHPTESRYRLRVRRWAALPDRSRSAAFIAQSTAERTGTRLLFADANTGCSGLAMDPHNPRVLFAGMWQVEMHTYAHVQRRPGQRGLRFARWRQPNGSAWKATDCHNRRSGKSTWLSRQHRIPAACTR